MRANEEMFFPTRVALTDWHNLSAISLATFYRFHIRFALDSWWALAHTHTETETLCVRVRLCVREKPWISNVHEIGEVQVLNLLQRLSNYDYQILNTHTHSALLLKHSCFRFLSQNFVHSHSLHPFFHDGWSSKWSQHLSFSLYLSMQVCALQSAGGKCGGCVYLCRWRMRLFVQVDMCWCLRLCGCWRLCGNLFADLNCH